VLIEFKFVLPMKYLFYGPSVPHDHYLLKKYNLVVPPLDKLQGWATFRTLCYVTMLLTSRAKHLFVCRVLYYLIEQKWKKRVVGLLLRHPQRR